MGDVISNMTGPQLIGFVAVVGAYSLAALVMVTAIVVPFFAAARRTEALAQLKRDMVVSGFSAADIERVVQATPKG
ncbi:MAG: hypothetical protein K2V38_28440 [Gemmataceae bacterium]|nr:hypothetical protein [Gemmataceae bacterium]